MAVDFQIIKRGAPLSETEWNESFDEHGRIMNSKQIKEKIASGGIVPEIRMDVWKYLLNYYPWESTTEERKNIDENMEYVNVEKKRRMGRLKVEKNIESDYFYTYQIKEKI